jgi:hypothetical protein
MQQPWLMTPSGTSIAKMIRNTFQNSLKSTARHPLETKPAENVGIN